jgi:hypothetical protein
VIPAKRGFLLPTGQWNRKKIMIGKPNTGYFERTVITEGDIAVAAQNGTMDHKSTSELLRKEGHIGFLVRHGARSSLQKFANKKVIKI